MPQSPQGRGPSTDDSPESMALRFSVFCLLVGDEVSAAAIWLARRSLDEAGFERVKIVASSGFGPAKCRMMAAADAPIDAIGAGSYLPERWNETYATADIVAYDGEPMVKAGREFLLRRRTAG